MKNIYSKTNIKKTYTKQAESAGAGLNAGQQVTVIICFPAEDDGDYRA